VTTKTFTYGTGIVTGSSTQIISEATLRTPTGAGNAYRVDPDSIIVCVWQLNAGAWNQLAPDDTNATAAFTTAVVSYTTVLNQISVKLDSAKDSKVIVTYKLMELSGV
jgi:delta 1-pyrroline-5-carboxylate dehydrogenase